MMISRVGFRSANVGCKKLALALSVIIAGTGFGLAWAALGSHPRPGYPYDTIFFFPKFRFDDLADMRMIALQPNPYIDPTAFYLPMFWVAVRWISSVSLSLQLIVLFCVTSGVVYLLLNRLFDRVVPDPRVRALGTLVLLLTCYPLLFCFDRGNVEIILFALVCTAIMLMARGGNRAVAACLLGAMCIKFTSALMLVLLVRQRRWGLAVLTIVAAVLMAGLGLVLLGCPMNESLGLYARNMQYYHNANVYENLTLEGAASPWNALKLMAITVAHWGWIEPIDFNFNNASVHAAYTAYTFLMTLLTALVAAYACLLEKNFFRAVVPLLLVTSIGAPSGGDYRLMYAGAALALLIAATDRRQFDLIALVLLALVMVPKKEIILDFVGRTETGFADVSLQVLLNPVLVLAALALLLAGSWKQLDLRWSWLRLVNLMRALRRPFA